MKWSGRIGRVLGIDLYVHVTFLVLLIYVAHQAYRARGLWVDAFGAVLFVAAFFGVVVLHELGHCLTARRFGIPTRDITLLPIGGVARLERLPERPGQELVIALAGPAVNVVLGVGLYALLRAPAPGQLLGGVRLVGGELLVNLFYANALMAVFNLIPAFPMDGGRVLRAVLAWKGDYARATERAATVGQALAWAFGSIALFKQNWWLLVIAVFVALGAEAESDFVRTRAALARVRVGDLMIREFHVLAPEEPLRRAVHLAAGGFQQDFPVVIGEKVVGMLSRRRLLAGLSRGHDRTPVRDFMAGEFPTALVWESAAEAFQRLQDSDCRAMPVLDQGRLAGLLTADQLSEHLLVRHFARAEPTIATSMPAAGERPGGICGHPPATPSSGA